MKNNNKLSSIIVFILVVLIVAISIFFITKPQKHYLQGEVEASQTIIAPLVAGRVADFYVKEGDTIKKGALIASIETPTLKAKLMQAEAAKSAAISQMKKADAGARKQQVQAAYNQWQQALAAEKFAKKTYERLESLFKDKVVAEQQRDEAYTKYTALKEQANAAKAMYDMAKQGARAEDKQAAKALVARAGGVVEEVNVFKKEAQVFSPSNGVVQSLILEKGEVVGAGTPVASLVDLSDAWMIVSVREDKLNAFKVGQTFTGSVPALGNKEVEWKVKNIAVMGSYATWTATKARGDFDKKTFEVKAYPTQKIVGLRPGMSVLVDESTLAK